MFCFKPLRISRRRALNRGSMLVTTIIFIGIISVLLCGVGSLVASAYNRAETDSDWVKALNIAEAGANTEIWKLSCNLPADVAPTTYSFGGGTYRVWITQRDASGAESMPWTAPNKLVIYSRGTFDGVTRTVRVSGKAFPTENDYAIYATGTGVSTGAGAAPTVVGDVGTNGKMNFASSPNINGELYFNGPDAEWATSYRGDYDVRTEPRPLEYETVQQIADRRFPNGGFTWLKGHNDNGRAMPAIKNNTITSTTVLPAGDYYLERLNLTGSNTIVFDNRSGPVNIWIGPEGGSGTNNFQGGAAAIPLSIDPAKRCAIYVATRGDFIMSGNTACDALIYAHNKDAAERVYGSVVIKGSPIIHGQVVAGTVDFRGQPTVIFEDLIKPLTPGHYGYDDSWQEGSFNQQGQWVEGTR